MQETHSWYVVNIRGMEIFALLESEIYPKVVGWTSWGGEQQISHLRCDGGFP